jgi:hypothetical protein
MMAAVVDLLLTMMTGLLAAAHAAAAVSARVPLHSFDTVGQHAPRCESTDTAGALDIASTPALMHVRARLLVHPLEVPASGWKKPHDMRMPRTPTSAPTLWPISAGGPSIAPIVMTTEHGGDDTEAGQRVGDFVEGARRHAGVVMAHRGRSISDSNVRADAADDDDLDRSARKSTA